jgi:hypothetical protein
MHDHPLSACGVPADSEITFIIMEYSIQLSSVKLLSTGVDGGHYYLRGRGVVNHEDTDVYVLFWSRETENEILERFTGQSVTVACSSFSSVPGIGVIVEHDCTIRFNE